MSATKMTTNQRDVLSVFSSQAKGGPTQEISPSIVQVAHRDGQVAGIRPSVWRLENARGLEIGLVDDLGVALLVAVVNFVDVDTFSRLAWISDVADPTVFPIFVIV